MFSKATLKQRLLQEFLRIIFSRRFLLFTSSLKKKTERNYVTFSYRHSLVCCQLYWHHSWHNNRLWRLTGLWGKKSQRDLGEGMLGMLVQCTKDSYAVLTVEVLCVLSCNVCAFVINIRQLNKTIRGEKKNYIRQEPITRSLHLHWFLESTFSRIDL